MKKSEYEPKYEEDPRHSKPRPGAEQRGRPQRHSWMLGGTPEALTSGAMGRMVNDGWPFAEDDDERA